MITILLNPQQKLKELKIKRLYQLIVSEKLNFDESGEVSTRLTVTKLFQFYHMKETRNFVFMTLTSCCLQVIAPLARFSHLPQRELFTLTVLPPSTWMTEASGAKHDLDNIMIGSTEEDVVANYTLRNIIVEGHCVDQVGHNLITSILLRLKLFLFGIR